MWGNRRDGEGFQKNPGGQVKALCQELETVCCARDINTLERADGTQRATC